MQSVVRGGGEAAGRQLLQIAEQASPGQRARPVVVDNDDGDDGGVIMHPPLDLREAKGGREGGASGFSAPGRAYHRQE